MPDKSWAKVENEAGLYTRKRKDDPSKSEYLLVYHLGWTEEYDEKTGKTKKKNNNSQKQFRTKREALEFKAKNEQNRARRGKQAKNVSRRLYFDECYQEFFDFNSKNWTAATIERNGAYGRRCVAYFNRKDPRDIETIDILKFYDWCREPHEKYPQTLSNKTIQKIRGYMLQIWKWWKLSPSKYGNIDPEVIRDADCGKIEKFIPNTWTSAQFNEALEYALKNEDDYSRIALLGLCGIGGLRRGELAGLRWGDIDYENKRLDLVRQRNQRTYGNEILDYLKKGDPNGKTRQERKQRYVAMPDKLAQILKFVYSQQTYYRGRRPKTDEYVYANKAELVDNFVSDPRRIDPTFEQLQKRMNKIREKQGKEPLCRLRLHDLRHSCISMLLNAGVPITDVAANSGHIFDEMRKLTTTNVYWHEDEKRDRILSEWDKLITADIAVPDMAYKFRPINRETKRPNLRSDEV